MIAKLFLMGLSALASLAIVLLGASMPASAQVRQTQTPDVGEQPQASSSNITDASSRTGRVASSSIGEIGQRQTREDNMIGVAPLARISTRINNRVQSRLRTRIDRNYDPQMSAAGPFSDAEQQTRRSGK